MYRSPVNNSYTAAPIRITRRGGQLTTLLCEKIQFQSQGTSRSDPVEQFTKGLDAFIKRCLEKVGAEQDNVLYCFQLRHPALRDKPFFRAFRNPEALSSTAILNEFNAMAQSNSALTLDATFEVILHARLLKNKRFLNFRHGNCFLQSLDEQDAYSWTVMVLLAAAAAGR